MSDLIERDALKKSILKRLGVRSDKYMQAAEKTLYEEILNAPTVDAEPVKHGKWQETVNSHCTCPVCGAEWSFFENETERFNCCPRCGARMVQE